MHPDLCKIGFGKSKLFSFPNFANVSILGPPGNSIPKILAVLSNASPNASSIVVPNLLYFPTPSTDKNCECPPDINNNKYGNFIGLIKPIVSA